MSTSTIVFIIIMGFTLIIYGGLTYLIVKKKDYSLISGFNMRPKEEQEELINRGYPQAIGKLLQYTFYILLIIFLLGVFNVPYGFEIGIAIFLLVLLGGMIYIQKYDLPHKRKKSTFIMTILTVVIFVVIIGVTLIGFQKNELVIEGENLKITGMYSVEWSLAEIDEVALYEELPEIEMRTNGFSSAGTLKGNFRLEEPYGKGKLFLYKNYPPYVYIKSGEEFIFINKKNRNETEEMYMEILEATE